MPKRLLLDQITSKLIDEISKVLMANQARIVALTKQILEHIIAFVGRFDVAISNG